MSLYDALSMIYNGVNNNPQDMLLLTLTYLKTVSPKQNSDRSIVLARLSDYIAKIEGGENNQDPAWLTKMLERGHTKSIKSDRWEASRISTVRDRPKIPNAPTLSPFNPQYNKRRRSKKKRAFEKKNPRATTRKLVPSKLNRSNLVPKEGNNIDLLESSIPNDAEELNKLSLAQLEISKAMSKQTIVSAVIDSCQTIFDPVDFVSLYIQNGKTFQSRLPHEKISNVINHSKASIFGQVVRKRKIINLTAEAAELNENFDEIVDSFQKKPCHLMYVPVEASGSGFFGIIKLCKAASKMPFSYRQVQYAACIARQTAISLENERIALGSLALSSVVNEISSSLDITDATLKLCKTAKKYLKCDSAMIFTSNLEKEELYFNSSRYSVSVPIDETSFVGACAVNKSILNVVKKAQEDIRLNKKIEELQKFPSSNVLCFPMIDNQTRKIVGVLRVSNKDAKKLFTRKDQVLLNGLAHIAMTVLSNARIHESALADRVKTDSLLKLAKSLNEQEDLLDLISSIQKEAKQLLECDRVSVFLHDNVTGELYTVAVGEDGTPFEIRFRSNVGLAGYSFVNSKLLNIEDAWEDGRFNNAFDKQSGYRTKSVLVMHIVNHVGNNIGVVQCINKKKEDNFTKMDELLIDAFASQCAVAIENLRNSERLADLQEYFTKHEVSAYDMYFEIDLNKKIIDVSRDAQSLKLFEEENIELILGKRIDTWLGEKNGDLLNTMLAAFKKPHNVLLKERTFVVPGYGGQTLVLDMNIIPVIHKYEKGERVNEVKRNYMHNMHLVGHGELFAHQKLGSFLIYCSNMRVKQSSGIIEHVTNYDDEVYEKDVTAMLSVALNCSPSIRQKAIVAIASEIHTGKGFVHHVENNTLVAIFGTPHSTTKDIMTAIDIGKKIVVLIEMMEEAIQNREISAVDDEKQEEKENSYNFKNGRKVGDIFLSAYVGVTSTKTRIWDRWSSHCKYEAYPESIAKSHWITEQCYSLGTKFLVDVDIAMHLPTRVITRRVGTVIWSGEAIDISLFHHLTPFEQQRAAIIYLKSIGKLDMTQVSSEVYEILSDKDLKDTSWLRLFDKAMTAFKSQQWSRAIKFFNEVLHVKNDDATSRYYKHICAKLLRSHTTFEGNAWSGVWQRGCERFILQYFGAEVDGEIWVGSVLSNNDIQPQHTGNVKTKAIGKQEETTKPKNEKAATNVVETSKPIAPAIKKDVFMAQDDNDDDDEAADIKEEINKRENKAEQVQEATPTTEVKLDNEEPSKLEDVDWVVGRMWTKYSASNNIEPKGLKLLFEDFTHQEISSDKCAKFIDSIDDDKNGKIDKSELIKFVRDGINLSAKHREIYKSRGGAQETLVKFFDSVKEKIMVRHSILERWGLFDVSNVGYLTPKQTKRFIEMESGTEISEEDCAVFINSIDENEDKKIDQNELIEFILHGLNLDNKQREVYATRGGSQQQILAFFDAFRKKTGIIPVIPLRDVKDIQDDQLLLQFFKVVDTDKSGTITKKELLVAMRKTILFENIAKKHNKLRPLLNGKTYLKTFKSINVSGTNEITFEELKKFVNDL